MLALVQPRRFARQFAWSLSTILATGLATPTLAQLVAPAPVRQSIDANGVDLFQGTFNVDAPSVTIGQGDTALTYYRLSRGSGWTDNLIATLNQTSSTMTVSLGGISDRFTISGSTYLPTEGNGASLSYNSTTKVYTYVRSDGTVIQFDLNRGNEYPYYANGGRVTDITSPSGIKLTFSYDSLYYCTHSKPGSVEDVCLSHGYIYRVASVRNSFGYQLAFRYGSIDEPDPNDPNPIIDFSTWSTPIGVSSVNLAQAGSGPGQSFGFTNNGGVFSTTVNDAHGVSSYRQDAYGIVLGVTRAGQSTETTTIAYSGGRVSSVTNARGTTTYTSSDPGDGTRHVTVTDAASQPTSYTFNLASQRMSAMTDALGHTTSYQYDSAGRPTQITQPEGNYTQFTYDSRGNVTERRAVSKAPGTPADIVTTASYPPSCTNAATCNHPTLTTDARGSVTNYSYDPTHGKVTSVTLPAQPNGIQPQTQYSYTLLTDSATGQAMYRLTGTSACRTTASCAGTADEVKTSITYETGNLLPVSSSTGAGDGTLTATTTATYDLVGNIVTVDGPLPGADDTTNFTYDAARERTGILSVDPDGAGALRRRAVKMYYNGDGNVYQTEIGTSDAGWSGYGVVQQSNTSYDVYGRKTSDTVSSSGTTYSQMDYAYDGLGRLSTSTMRMLGQGNDRTMLTGYDVVGRVASTTSAFGTAEAATETTSYTPNGKTASVTDANGNVTAYGYDGVDRLAQTTYPSPSSAGSVNAGDYEALGYDANANVISRRLRDGNIINYGYDALDRLVAYDSPNYTADDQDIAFNYDNLGHLTQAAKNAQNRTNFTYDALGRKLTESNYYYSLASQYDLAGRRTQLTWGDGFYVNYNYYANGADRKSVV